MKQYTKFTLILTLILILTLSGCGGSSGSGGGPISIAETLVPVTTSTSFPIDTNPDDSVIDDSSYNMVTSPYYIAKYEVTYKVWKEVYDWATAHAYFFVNHGEHGGGYDKTSNQAVIYTSGHENDPVTNINWRDAIIWCNALTEYYNSHYGKNLGCVYKDGGNIIRSSGDIACDSVVPDTTAKGFRLPTSMEWECAARYKNGILWTPGDYASGANAPYTDVNAVKAVAWYEDNSNIPDPNIYSTQPVGQKFANALGIYDMSGNVQEWCFDLKDSSRVCRGGIWYWSTNRLRILFMNSLAPSYAGSIGLRPVRSQ